MKSFLPAFIDKYTIHPGTAWYLSQCAEARGMQELWRKVRPEVLRKLTESAIIQSTESSNRIEGIEVAKNRLLPLVLGKTKPRDRSEEEIIGYRKALSWIHKEHSKIEIDKNTIQKLHKTAQGGLISDAGKWKSKDNDIIEILPNGERKIRFHCLSAKETPKAITQLCLGYEEVVQNNRLPDLTSVSNFIFDFLCIHPFRDGNGRVSRLLTLLLLYKHGYEVGKFIGLERIIEETKEEYYRALSLSSENWHKSNHDLMHWTNYFLGVIKNAYQELKERVESKSSGDTSSSIIRDTALEFNSTFSVADICNIHPNLNRELVKKVLFSLKAEGIITLIGKGRGARWKKNT